VIFDAMIQDFNVNSPRTGRMNEAKKKDWRELCAAVVNEHNSEKLALLIQELAQALNEHTQKPDSLMTHVPNGPQA